MPGRRAAFSPQLVAFVAIYMLACGSLALGRGNTEFIIYALAMVVFIAITALIHRSVRFSPATLWLLAIWGGLHMAGGTVPIPASIADAGAAKAVLYSARPFDWGPRYDQVTHAFGFFSATIAAWEALRSAIAAQRHSPASVVRPTFGLTVAAVLMGVGLGAVNEVVEFAVTLTVPDHNVGGYINTGWDLVANSVGATTAGLIILIGRSPKAPS